MKAIFKKSDQAGDSSPWLEKFCSKHDIPASLVDILAENAITSEAIFAGITEQDVADMRLVVGHKVILREVLSTLTKSRDSPTALAESSSDGPDVLPFKLADELAKVEAEFQDSKKTAPSATPHHLQPAAHTQVEHHHNHYLLEW